MAFVKPLDTVVVTGDPWAQPFFAALLDGKLAEEDFEEAVSSRWQDGAFIGHAPETAAWLYRRSMNRPSDDGGYAAEAPELGFRSQWLAGTLGRPGAIHIQAPAEASVSGELAGLNRPLHQHDSGRIAIITSGEAVFHVLTPWAGDGMVLDCPMSTGDLVFWPAWTPHTFNAGAGFSLVSAMARYVSPAEDGFVFPVDEALARLPRRVCHDGSAG
jgi:hypothetical protein